MHAESLVQIVNCNFQMRKPQIKGLDQFWEPKSIYNWLLIHISDRKFCQVHQGRTSLLGVPVPLLLPCPSRALVLIPPHFSTIHAHIDFWSSPWLVGFWWIVFSPSPICLVLLSQLGLYICLGSPRPYSNTLCRLRRVTESPPSHAGWSHAPCRSTSDTRGDWHCIRHPVIKEQARGEGKVALMNDCSGAVLFK